ncbi:MAG: hypothetical protein NT029_21935 [Armatimonadetes bacterium]|nr:hypothetical protein [Armatimonadota bacterium]
MTTEAGQQKGNDPKTIVALIVGIILVLVFVVWQITNAMSAKNPAPPPAAQSSTSGAPTEPLAPAPSATASAAGGGDVALAPGVDPFKPLTPRDVLAMASRRPAVAGAPGTGLPPAPGGGNTPWTGGFPTALPPAAGGRALPAPMAVQAPQPALAGTLLGGQPTGMFRTERGLTLVPEGGSVMGWTVARVQEGSVVLRLAGRVVKLSVEPLGKPAFSPSPAAAPRSALPSPPPVAVQAASSAVRHSRRRMAGRRSGPDVASTFWNKDLIIREVADREAREAEDQSLAGSPDLIVNRN